MSFEPYGNVLGGVYLVDDSGTAYGVKQVNNKPVVDVEGSLLELLARLDTIASCKGILSDLRTSVVSSVSVAVTGPVTSAQLTSENQRINNLNAVISNVNNTLVV